jgi:hypothetical protein
MLRGIFAVFGADHEDCQRSGVLPADVGPEIDQDRGAPNNVRRQCLWWVVGSNRAKCRESSREGKDGGNVQETKLG